MTIVNLTGGPSDPLLFTDTGLEQRRATMTDQQANKLAELITEKFMVLSHTTNDCGEVTKEVAEFIGKHMLPSVPTAELLELLKTDQIAGLDFTDCYYRLQNLTDNLHKLADKYASEPKEKP